LLILFLGKPGLRSIEKTAFGFQGHVVKVGWPVAEASRLVKFGWANSRFAVIASFKPM